MLSKIKSINGKPEKIDSSLRDELLHNLQEAVGTLPKDYMEFMKAFGGEVNFGSLIIFKGIEPSPWADENGYDNFERFYGLSREDGSEDIFEIIERYEGDLKKQWLPVGASAGGNQIVLCLNGSMMGKVFFWDHEKNPCYDKAKRYDGLSLCADSFKCFVKQLVVEQDSGTPSKAIGGYLNF